MPWSGACDQGREIFRVNCRAGLLPLEHETEEGRVYMIVNRSGCGALTPLTRAQTADGLRGVC